MPGLAIDPPPLESGTRDRYVRSRLVGDAGTRNIFCADRILRRRRYCCADGATHAPPQGADTQAVRASGQASRFDARAVTEGIATVWTDGDPGRDGRAMPPIPTRSGTALCERGTGFCCRSVPGRRSPDQPRTERSGSSTARSPTLNGLRGTNMKERASSDTYCSYNRNISIRSERLDFERAGRVDMGRSHGAAG